MDQEKTPIIDAVPGMPAFEAPTNSEQHGQAVVVEDFRGDPRRVIGHSSNPTNEAVTAYSKAMKDQEQESTWKNIPVRYVTSAGAIALSSDKRT